MRLESRFELLDIAFVVVFAAGTVGLGVVDTLMDVPVATVTSIDLTRVSTEQVRPEWNTFPLAPQSEIAVGDPGGRNSGEVSPAAWLSALPVRAPGSMPPGQAWPEFWSSRDFLAESALAVRGPRISGEDSARTTTSLWVNAPASIGSTSSDASIVQPLARMPDHEGRTPLRGP